MKDKNKKALGDLKTENSLKIKNLRHWRPKDFWELSLKKYRVSKKIRKIINKNGRGFMFRELAKQLGVTRHYIYQVMMMSIKSNNEFINELEKLEEILNTTTHNNDNGDRSVQLSPGGKNENERYNEAKNRI